jgi:hypothetical protein
MKWAALETEVSPSNFSFAAKDIVDYPRVQPAAKLKSERLTFARESCELKMVLAGRQRSPVLVLVQPDVFEGDCLE